MHQRNQIPRNMSVKTKQKQTKPGRNEAWENCIISVTDTKGKATPLPSLATFRMLSLSLYYLFSHLVSSSSRPRCLLENTLGGANFLMKEAGAWPLVCICFATLPFCRRRTIFRFGPRDLFLEVSTAKELDATSKIPIHLDHLGPYVKAEWEYSRYLIEHHKI